MSIEPTIWTHDTDTSPRHRNAYWICKYQQTKLRVPASQDDVREVAPVIVRQVASALGTPLGRAGRPGESTNYLRHWEPSPHQWRLALRPAQVTVAGSEGNS